VVGARLAVYAGTVRAVLGLVALLLAAALVLSLTGRDATHALRSVRRAIPGLEERAEPRPFDRQAADAMVARLRRLAQAPAPAEAELDEAADTAAGWAAGATPGTGAYRAAVALRGAAVELLGGADEARRQRALRLLDDADEALAGGTAMPGGVGGAIEDQLRSQQYQRDQQARQVERETR
jgi:Sec-independent protein translocase protein TatA